VNLISISIRRSVFAWMLMAAMIIFGAVSFNRLGVSQLPDVDFPILNVSIDYEGASPEVVEAEILDRLEERLLAVEGIREMKSSARQGSGRITLEFNIERNVDVALQEVQSSISQMRMPTGVDPPTIRKQNPEESPIMFIGVQTDRPLRETLQWTEEYLLDQFRFLPGVGEISIAGFSQRNLRIWPDVKKLKQYSLSILDIITTIETQHRETAAGQFSAQPKELRVRWLGEGITPEEIGNIYILSRGGETVQSARIRIKDVARVEDGLSDVRRIARIDGKPAVSIMVRKQRGGNEVTVADAIRKKIEELRPSIPPDFNVDVNIDLTRSTEAVVKTTYSKLWLAALITILVCFAFLGSFQAALNILFSIPTSIVGTFLILYFSRFTLNLFTLLALTLAISIVVDDAIMLLENIVRHYRMGKSPAQAAYDGSMEILPAATAATLAVVAVFLPVVFMTGITGKFFFQFGVTMSAAVLLSLLEAVTITPMRASFLLATSPGTSRLERRLDEAFKRVSAAYSRFLAGSLGFAKWIVLASVLLFGVSLFLMQQLKQEFVPTQDQDLVAMTATTPTGSTLEVTDEAVKKVEEIIRKHPAVQKVLTSVGAGGGPGSNEVNSASIWIHLVSREKRKKTHMQIMDEFRKELKAVRGIRISMRDMSARGLTSGRLNPVSLNLRGPNLDVLAKKADELIAKLDAEGLTVDMDTDFKMGLPELLIRPDRTAMINRGVSIDAVARTLNAAIAGPPFSGYTADGQRHDIRVKIPEADIRSVDDLKYIEVRNNYGNYIPLSQLVKTEERKTYQAINRVNRQRAIGVFGNVATGQSQGRVLARAQELAREILPEGYSLSLEGASAGLAESFRSLTGALILGILVAYMILAVQFNSFLHPMTVLVALPFSVTGAMLILYLSGVSLNLFSFIGVIVLMGIAKKNSILLVEFTNHVRAAGTKDVRKALIEACPIRLRPILMTSVATVAAAIPLVFGNSIGQETRTPMGLTIIGGTVVSTIFTLIVVPSLYLLLSRLERESTVDLDTAPKQAPH
jgi:hydrophobe/amphiphile efflux-1 (HAE1) family protein